MSEHHVERRLTAILAADIAGYSRLMAADEEDTLTALRASRALIERLVADHHGRVFASAGDSLVAEFASPVATVRCAVAAQAALARFNAERAPDRQVQFRMGVHLGDVMVEGDDLLGDGVNIAARLQEVAEPGGIAVSEAMRVQVHRLVGYTFEDAGTPPLKNIAEPVHVFRVSAAGPARSLALRSRRRLWPAAAGVLASVAMVALIAVLWLQSSPPVPPPRQQAVAQETERALPLPDRPSIAVLAFENLGDDAAQEYFADGIAEDIITDLSRIPGLFVIARNSSFAYKGAAVNIAEISRDLGVRYVLEGSVRKEGDRVRVTTQLIDGTTGGHVWAERYDRELNDVFAVQDDVTQEVVQALKVELTEPNRRRVRRPDTANMEAYDLFLRGRALQSRITQEGNSEARDLFVQAIELDPDFARAHSLLAWTHLDDWRLGWTDYDPRSLEEAARIAQVAVELDPDDPLAHAALGDTYVWQHQHERAIEELEQAVALQPNRAEFHAMLGDVLTWAGRADEGLPEINQARRLNPNSGADYMWQLGHALFQLRRYEDAIAAFDEAIDRSSAFWPGHLFKAASLAHLGRVEEAGRAADLATSLNPRLQDLDAVAAPYRNAADVDHLMSGLRNSGIGG